MSSNDIISGNSGESKEFLPKTETEVVQRAEESYRLVHQERFHPGHQMFSYNRKTGAVTVAEVETEVSMGLDLKPIVKRKIKRDPDCVYGQALNEKNFIRKLEKVSKLAREKEKEKTEGK